MCGHTSFVRQAVCQMPYVYPTLRPGLLKEEWRQNHYLQTARKQPLKSSFLLIPCKYNKKSHKEAASLR